MCFGGSKQPVDNSAEVARQQEETRKGLIQTGQQNIDSAFGMFDPAYFDKFKTDYLNYYDPQVDKQFDTTKRDLRYDLARKGVLDSTPGNRRFADLIDLYGQRRDEVSSNATSATAGQQNAVENYKSQLYSQNSTAADPSLAAQSAVSATNSLTTPQPYSPIGDLFAGIVNGTTNAVRAGQNALPAGYSQYFQPGYYSAPSSGRVVT